MNKVVGQNFMLFQAKIYFIHEIPFEVYFVQEIL